MLRPKASIRPTRGQRDQAAGRARNLSEARGSVKALGDCARIIKREAPENPGADRYASTAAPRGGSSELENVRAQGGLQGGSRARLARRPHLAVIRSTLMHRDKVVATLRDVLVPLLEADGGEVYLVHLDVDELHLHVTGRFSGCPGNTLVERRILEPALNSVAPGMNLRVTSGPLIPESAEALSQGSPG